MSNEQAFTMSLAPLAPETANEQQRSALENGKQISGGMIPNMFSRMAHAPGLLNMYVAGYMAFRNESALTPAEQEVVLLTVSTENHCDYCMTGHRYMSDHVWKTPAEVSAAVVEGKPLPDAKLEALARFTRSMMAAKGHPSQEETAAFLNAGYTERNILDVVHAIALKTISNYNNHLFRTPSDFA